jgi:predicted HD phosphohydrolase
MGGDRHVREALRGHEWFQSCADFCENWDQASFDPDYETLPLAHFRPLLERVFARPRGD